MRKLAAALLISILSLCVLCAPLSAQQFYPTAPATTFTFSVSAAGGANVSEITITPKAIGGRTVTGVQHYDLWLSDASSCAGLTGTTASGAVTNKTSSGVVIDTYTAKKALRVQTLSTGLFILSVTDTAKTTFYVCAQAPGSGKAVAAHLATASYGS